MKSVLHDLIFCFEGFLLFHFLEKKQSFYIVHLIPVKNLLVKPLTCLRKPYFPGPVLGYSCPFLSEPGSSAWACACLVVAGAAPGAPACVSEQQWVSFSPWAGAPAWTLPGRWKRTGVEGGARGAVGTGRLTVLCPQASPPSGGSPVPVACATHGRTSLEFSAVPTTLTLEQTGLSKEGLDGFGFPAHGPFF